MRKLKALWQRLRNLLSSTQAEREFAAEFQAKQIG